MSFSVVCFFSYSFHLCRRGNSANVPQLHYVGRTTCVCRSRRPQKALTGAEVTVAFPVANAPGDKGTRALSRGLVCAMRVCLRTI